MGQRGRHAAPRAGMQRVRRVAAVVLAAGALASAGTSAAFADMLEDIPLSGEQNIDQVGAQNLACGNSARLVRLNVAQIEHRDRVCTDDDGHTGHNSAHAGGARAEGVPRWARRATPLRRASRTSPAATPPTWSPST